MKKLIGLTIIALLAIGTVGGSIYAYLSLSPSLDWFLVIVGPGVLLVALLAKEIIKEALSTA